MVCAMRITVVICLLVSGVRPENESSDTSVEIDEARIKRQENQFTQNFRFNNNVSPSTSAQLQQQLLNQQQLSSFRSRVGQSALGLGGNNRFTSPSRFSGRTQNLVLTQGQLVAQNQQNSQRQVPQQSFQRFAPQQLSSPAPFQSNFQSSPVLLNNDPLGLFRGNSQGQRSTGTSPVNTRAGTVERLQPQTNFENLRQANGFQQPGFTPQQILNFQRQQLQQALAGIPGRNQNSIVPRQGVSFQRFSPSAPAAPQNTQAFRPSQQFQPSFQAQVPSQNNFQSNQVRQFQVQPQALPFVQQQVPQRPQANFFANQPRQVQQAIQPQQLQQAIQPQQLQQAIQPQQLQQANQPQQIQQTIQPQRLQQQPQQLQLQQLQQQAIQPQQLQQQSFRSSQQLNQIQQQQAFLQQLLRRQQVINQLRQQQLQQQARGQIQQQTQTSLGTQPTPLPTTRQPVQRPTSSFSPSSFSTNTPRGSFGQPLPTANIPATQNAPASFGVPLQTTRQPIRQTANVQQTFRAPGQAASPPARPAAAAQTTFGVPLQTTANRLAQPVALSRPTSAPASFGVPLSPVQQPNQITSAQPTIQQLRQQQPQRSGVLLSQTRPQSSGIQNQAFSGAGGLVNTVSQLQQGRPTGGFTILRDDDDDDDFNDRTDEINDSRERFLGGGGRLNSGGFTGASVGVPLRFNGVSAGVGSFAGAPSVGNNAVGGSGGTFSRASPVGIPLQFGGAAASAGNVFRPSSGGVPLGSSISQGRTFNAIPLQIRPDITQEDITVEVNSREIFRPSSLRTSGGFQPSFGNRITRVGLDLTNENLTTEDRTLELFDD